MRLTLAAFHATFSPFLRLQEFHVHLLSFQLAMNKSTNRAWYIVLFDLSGWFMSYMVFVIRIWTWLILIIVSFCLDWMIVGQLCARCYRSYISLPKPKNEIQVGVDNLISPLLITSLSLDMHILAEFEWLVKRWWWNWWVANELGVQPVHRPALSLFQGMYVGLYFIVCGFFFDVLVFILIIIAAAEIETLVPPPQY